MYINWLYFKLLNLICMDFVLILTLKIKSRLIILIFNFLFTTNINIFNDIFDDNIFVNVGPFFVKEYITDNQLLKIKNQLFVNNNFINYSELYFLKKFL